MSEILIRMAVLEDAQALLAIYAPYVEKTAITFEYEVPTVNDFRGRMERVLQRYPYLVAEVEGQIVGYAYASAFHARAAYDWCVEVSVYVKCGMTGNGCGKRLYQELERILKKQHVINLYACIAYTSKEDAYLTNQSQFYHEHMGYRLIGTFQNSGYKFGRWYDMIWMEKIVDKHSNNPEKVRAIQEVLTWDKNGKII